MRALQQLKMLEQEFRARDKVVASHLAVNCGCVEATGGVYGIWDLNNQLIYFGETCHLNHRVEEMVIRGRHHSVALVLGEKAAGLAGRERAKLFCDLGFRVSWMKVELGRAELEDFIVCRRDVALLNKPQKRFTFRSDYSEWISDRRE